VTVHADVTRRYLWGLYPDPGYSKTLHWQCRLVGELKNAMLQRCQEQLRRTLGQRHVRHREGKSLPSAYDLCYEIKLLRQECPEYRALPAATMEEIARHVHASYVAFFRNIAAGNFEQAGEPRFKRRDQMVGIPLGVMQNRKTGVFQTKGWRLWQREDNPRSWLLHLAGVTDARDHRTWIPGRGTLPAEPSLWRNADILFRAGKWMLSIVVEIPLPAGTTVGVDGKMRVEFDLLTHFATVNGVAETPPDLLRALKLQDELVERKGRLAVAYPRTRQRLDDDAYQEKMTRRLELSRLSLKIANVRRNALHVWTTQLVERASDITIVKPPVREYIKTPRGTSENWGANTAKVSQLNRQVRNFAPSAAIRMLQYKAAEKGIRCDIVAAETTNLTLVPELVTVGKLARRASRLARKLARQHDSGEHDSS
jgi:transposase